MSLTRASAAVIKTEEIVGTRNRIINGAMEIDQRNAGASVTAGGTNVYPVDRFAVQRSTAGGGFTAQQSTTAPSGFTNSIVATVTSSSSVSGTDRAFISQFIEGYNTADLAWGTANAQPVTVSFWVRSSLTGTFGGSITNNDVNRSYPFTYIISSADTWEYKTVTIPGDTSGTWLTNNSVGLRVYWGIGVGPDRSGTAGTWASADYRSATGAVNVLGTSGATFYLTGVQLEVGSTATPFERRPFGTELALCQRYYQQYGGDDTLTTMSPLGTGINSTQARVPFVFPVPMRVAPSVTQLSAGIADGVNAVVALTAIAISTNQGGKAGSNLITTVSSGITQYRPYWVLGNSNTSSYIAFSGEL